MAEDVKKVSVPYLRLTIGGFFMGLANLVPGVSGGTMVLALGLYEEFIGAMASLSRLRFTFQNLIVLVMLFGISFLTIGAGAGVIEFLMEMFKPGMLALFIGMTLGGVPMLLKEMKPVQPISILFCVIGIIIMALLAFMFRPDTGEPGWVLFFVGGLVASSSMILPGISGSYMLLILGLYIPTISGISEGVDALRAGDLSTCFDLGFAIGLPLGLGLLIGVVGFSNVIRVCLDRFHKPTIGFLMGLLLGSVLGLYPFAPATFDKLPRYAVAEAAGESGTSELRVMGYGWENSPNDPIFRNLRELQGPTMRVRILSVRRDNPPTEAEVTAARELGAVMVVYDIRTPKEVRRAASHKVEGKDVEFIFVPNSELTALKGVLAILLIVVGFTITFFLGRLRKEDEGTREKDGFAPAAAG